MSGKFPWCFKEVLKEFQGSSESVSREFQERFNGASRKIEGCFMWILSGIQEYLKEVEKQFQGVLKNGYHFLVIPQPMKHPQIQLRGFYNSPFCGLLKIIQKLYVCVKIVQDTKKKVLTKKNQNTKISGFNNLSFSFFNHIFFKCIVYFYTDQDL